jgi:Excalibur calcium-binding domain
VRPLTLLPVVTALAALLAGCGSDLPKIPTEPTWSTASESPTASTTPVATSAPTTTTVLAAAEPLPLRRVPPTRPRVPTTLRAAPRGTTTAAPGPATTQKRTTTEKASGPYFRSCTEAKAAGAAPLHVGEPGYRSGLDGDGDGVACQR